MTTILRPLSTSELLDRTFHLYRNRFLFVGIAAIPQLGVFAAHLVDASIWFRHWMPSRAGRTALLYVASFIAVQIAHAATVSAVAGLHLGSHSDIWSAYVSVKKSLLRVTWISLVAFALPFAIAFLIAAVSVGIAFASFRLFGDGLALRGSGALAGLLAFFVLAPLGATRWWINWSLVVPVTVLEGGGLRATMRRSRSLVEGRRWRVFVIYLLVAGLTWTVTILLQTPFYAMVQWRGFLRAVRISDTAVLVSAGGSFVSQSFVVPLLTIAFTLIYYDERVRREGFDLQWMISTLEATRENPTAAPASL